MRDLASILLLVFMVSCATAVIVVEDLLSVVIIFGAFSFLSAAFFTLSGALDVALTEAAVGAVITTVFFVVAIYWSDRKVRK